MSNPSQPIASPLWSRLIIVPELVPLAAWLEPSLQSTPQGVIL